MPLTHCGADMSRLAQLSNEDIAVIEDTLAERVSLGVTQETAERQAVAEAIAQLTNERISILDAVAAQYPELTAKPAIASQPDTASKQPQAPENRAQAAINSVAEPEPILFRQGKPSPAAKMGQGMLRSSPVAGSLASWVSDKLYDFRQQPWIGALFTNSQLGEMFDNLPAVRKINEATRRMTQVANRYMLEAHKIDLHWRALSDPTSLELNKLMLETTMAQTSVSANRVLATAWSSEENNHLDRNDPKVRAKFEELHRRYWTMDDAARKVYASVRSALESLYRDRVSLVQMAIARSYATALGRVLTPAEVQTLREAKNAAAVLKTEGFAEFKTPAQARVLQRLVSDLHQHNKEFGMLKGPYFPLVRFGDHVVVSKSPTITQAEDKIGELRTKLEPLYAATTEENPEGTQIQIDALRKQIAEAQTTLDNAKKNDSDYSVQFFERPSDARRAEAEMRAAKPDATVYHTLREQYYRGLDSVTPAFFERLQETLSASLDAGDTPMDPRAKADVLNSVRDMYLTRSPENAALKAELKRQGIDGVKAAEMRRGFAAMSQSGSWRISRLTHAHDVAQGMNDLAADKSLDARSILNEYKRRMAQTMTQPKPNKMLASVNNVSHFMYLGLSPAYFLTNMSQTWVTSMPIMAGRFGIGRTSSALAKASRDVIPMLMNAAKQGVRRDGLVGLTLDLDINTLSKELKLTDGETELIRALSENGALDISMAHDVGATASGESSNIMSRMMEVSAVITNYPEVYNRLATSLAAYRLHMENADGSPQSHDRAVAYADKIIDNTHLNYSEENAPRFMRGNIQRVVFQFKRYMQGMIYLMGKTIHDAMKGDPDAARAFAYLMATNLTVAGAAGLPIAAPVAFLAKIISSLWPDDDEPELMQMVYNGMKDAIGEPAARALAKGAPTLAGLNLSGSIGMGNILNPIGFARTDDKDMFSQEWWAQAALALAGPGAGLAAKWGQSLVDAQKGDLARAAAGALPRFAANPLKAYQREEAGVTSKHGDVLIDPSEFGAWSTFAKGLGFESAAVGDMYDNRSAFNEMRQNKQEARNKLLKQYVRARSGADGGSMGELQSQVAEFNSRHPDDPIRQTNLLSAYKQHLVTQREMVGGIRIGKRDHGIARELGIE